ncbi:MAG TPA: Wzz/FepE/Etk N-terminal domain-containing protein [Prolixibacteraceae bacterium]|nr:Wzz/FepE/Etk N-terminal domain-containing protein [Prolixibacteraceae bacterium]
MTNFFDNQNLLGTLQKWLKHLIVIGILAIVISAIFSSSLFIKPKYKSTARVYPSINIYSFSEESQSEQLLEIINSQDIKLQVIEAFNLGEVYKISKKNPQYMTSVLSEFDDNFTFKKTEYETIEIQVLDTDPQRACTMCDSIIAFMDDKVRTLHRVKYDEAALIAKKDIAMLTHQIDSIEEKLDVIREKYKILDFTLQAKEITRGMVRVLAEQNGNTTGGKKIEQWMNDLSEQGGEFILLSKKQAYIVVQAEALKKIYDEAVSGAHKKITYGQRVQNPVPADKKSYPIRWLIVLTSTFATLFSAILVILLLEIKKNA